MWFMALPGFSLQCVADGNSDCLKNCTKPNLVARHLDGKNFIGKEF